MQARIEHGSERDQLGRPPRAELWSVNPALLSIAILAAVAAAVIAVYVSGHQVIPQDVTLEDDVQSIGWGPLAMTFPIFSWIGDAKGAALEAVIFIAILIFNRRTWIFAAGASLSAGWYVLISHLVVRARPTTAQVLHVTEHPGGSSFPSGHTIFVATIVTVLMICFGHRFLPRWGRVVGWILAVLITLANGISRVYTGAHWPTDVLAAILIATGWLCLWMSFRRVSGRALST
ncbi:MAG: phosphatase PAP2 family protein [Candidatus Dormibacteraceae bacterium]